MRLVYEPCNLDLDISTNDVSVSVIVIENVKIFVDFLGELWREINGEDGKIFISEGSNAVNLEKKAVYISNPFSVDVNDKKIITKLYHDMKDICLNEEYEQLSLVNSSIITLLDGISEKLSYPINYDIEIEPLNIFKNYSVMIENETEGLLERLLNYMKMTHQVLGTELFIFFHITDYLNQGELEYIIESASYEHFTVLLLESSHKNRLEHVKYCIIDADNCLIEY